MSTSQRRGLNWSSVLLSAIVLFSVLQAGWGMVHAGWGKAVEEADVWLFGDGSPIVGFMMGANNKATFDPEKNPNPEVFPVMRDLNEEVFIPNAGTFATLVALGELLAPIGALIAFFVVLAWSKHFLIAAAAANGAMNLVFLSQGTSSSNPPMVAMWMTIGLGALFVAGSVFYLSPIKNFNTDVFSQLDDNAGNRIWLVLWFVALAVGAWAMHWDQRFMFWILTIVWLVLVGGLVAMKSNSEAEHVGDLRVRG